MERLTMRRTGATGLNGLTACYDECDNPDYGCNCERVRTALRRLAEYEDTGMTPEQIMKLREDIVNLRQNSISMESYNEIHKNVIKRLNGEYEEGHHYENG